MRDQAVTMPKSRAMLEDLKGNPMLKHDRTWLDELYVSAVSAFCVLAFRKTLRKIWLLEGLGNAWCGLSRLQQWSWTCLQSECIDESSSLGEDVPHGSSLFVLVPSLKAHVCQKCATLHSCSQFSMLSHDPYPSWETSRAPCWVKQLLMEETLKHKSTQVQKAKLTTSDSTCWYRKDIFDFLSILGMISRRSSIFCLHVFWVYNYTYIICIYI